MVVGLAGLATWPGGAQRRVTRRRGLAIWLSEIIAASPRRSCRHLRFTAWQELFRGSGDDGEPGAQGRSARKGQLLLTADSLWVASVCAVALFHRPLVLVVDAARYTAVAGLPGHGALAERWRMQDGDDMAALRSLMESGDTVVWVLSHDDLTAVAEGARDVSPTWSHLAAEASQVFWLRAQPQSDDVVQLFVDAIPQASPQGPDDAQGWVDAVQARLQDTMKADPLALGEKI